MSEVLHETCSAPTPEHRDLWLALKDLVSMREELFSAQPFDADRIEAAWAAAKQVLDGGSHPEAGRLAWLATHNVEVSKIVKSSAQLYILVDLLTWNPEHADQRTFADVVDEAMAADSATHGVSA